MALIGTYTKYTMQPTEELREYVITYPSAEHMGEGDPNIDKAGTTETVTEPVYQEVAEDIENTYVNITNYAIIKNEAISQDDTDPDNLITLGLDKWWSMNVHYRVYASLEDKENDPSNYIDYGDRTFDLPPGDRNIMEWAYEQLKNEKGFNKLLNDL